MGAERDAEARHEQEVQAHVVAIGVAGEAPPVGLERCAEREQRVQRDLELDAASERRIHLATQGRTASDVPFVLTEDPSSEVEVELRIHRIVGEAGRW